MNADIFQFAPLRINTRKPSGPGLLVMTVIGLASLLAPAVGCGRVLASTNASTTTDVQVPVGTDAKGIVISASAPSVAVGNTDAFTVSRAGGAQVTGGQWAVLGGTAYGSIDPNGLFHAPAVVPRPAAAVVAYVYSGMTFTGTVTITSPAPVINASSPTVLTSLSSSVTLVGSNFVSGSIVTVNGVATATSFIDPTHVSCSIVLPAPTSGNVSIAVVNPDGKTSIPLAVATSFNSLSITPAVLSSGPLHLTIQGSGFNATSTVMINNKVWQTTFVSPSELTASGYLLPWLAGNVAVTIVQGNEQVATLSVPIAPTAVSYDTAARFMTQAAFGPRPGMVEHIQQVGLDAFITEQFQQAPIVFPTVGAKTTYILEATRGNALLRQRVAYAIQSFIVPQWQDFDPSSTCFEDQMEADVTRNFRDLILDAAMNPNVAKVLNLGNNFANNLGGPPNQNFARELLQLFTIGPFLLNDDGTVQLDYQGQPIPSYDQDTVIAVTRALTGWYYPTPVNPATSAWGIDWSQPLSAYEPGHDHGAKVLFGNIQLSAGSTITADRDAVLDALFNHPNVPAFISKRLIQHLVTSNPSPEYVRRVATIFKNNGAGVRGDMASVVRSILLDPEARAGDTTPAANDGFLQEPIIYQAFAMSMLQDYGSDGQIDYSAQPLGEALWSAPTVFGFVSPSYTIPGTTITSPEFSLYTNLTAAQRTYLLWGMISEQAPGYSANYVANSWLFNNFSTVPDMLDALNHIAFHGQMSQAQQTVISSYVSQLSSSDPTLQLQSTVFLALNSDSFNVSH